MHNFLELNAAELAKVFTDWELPAYRIGQIRRWIFARKTAEFEQMTDLPKGVRTLLSEQFGSILRGKEWTRLQSDDSSQKLLIELEDGERIECVLLQNDRHHRTACVSTQVGCAMKCTFCASGMDGFVRNLTRSEILEQLLRLNALLPDHERLTHIVVMGIGEPMLNLNALLSALDDATTPEGLDISIRRVTISTVGIPAGIRKLADSVVQGGNGYKLAVSLHAPNDELRSQLIPQNLHSGIAAVLSATDEYFQKTGRRVTFEYTLIEGLNDQPEHIVQLADLLRHRTAIVNVIPLNPVPNFGFRPPSSPSVQRFVKQLEHHGIQVKIRFRKGDKITAACGQLRRSRKDEE
ncbi:MAG: 23S rRNA (adenine(2503)-C(2))-methyltransferase RlmN [Planctomycetaceae bacterium]|jgi:23S rRNA (adenine2503-C2)-methyltransferase|nr:23S rRNA (adenine(2503)-C(2))-methyltransferase RlmN [Planctomycetaceae bacterium]